MSDATRASKELFCPSCGAPLVMANKCTAAECDWVGCEDEDHDYIFVGGDRSVGLASCLECKDCNLQIDDDGRFDQDWEDNAI